MEKLFGVWFVIVAILSVSWVTFLMWCLYRVVTWLTT